jgi:hypothetical protein
MATFDGDGARMLVSAPGAPGELWMMAITFSDSVDEEALSIGVSGGCSVLRSASRAL